MVPFSIIFVGEFCVTIYNLFVQSQHQKSGKCENLAKNRPDYVKITP